jgi:hypothetical protein
MLLSLSVKEIHNLVSCIDNAYGDGGADYQDLELGIKLVREVMKEQSKPDEIRWNMHRIESFLILIEQAKMREIENGPLP